MTSVNALIITLLLAWSPICSVSGAVSFSETPESTCVCGGNSVTFDCIALSESVDLDGNTGTAPAAQRWEIVPLSGTVIMVDSAPSANNPEGYDIVLDSDNYPIGLTVVNPDISLNQASLVCTGYDPNSSPVPSASAPAITLEVAGLSSFTCSVTCPETYSSVNNFCDVTWTSPTTSLCVNLTGFSLSVTNALAPKMFEVSRLGSTTGDLEPFRSYTATVTAINSCDYNRQCSYSFTTPKEEAPENFSIDLVLVTRQHLAISTVFTTSNPPMVTDYSVVVGQGPLQQTFSSLSLNISSLQQCMNYTVSVTATNTGGSTTASTKLVLDFLTLLEVECSASVTGCYLDIAVTCVKDYPRVVSGCTVHYTREDKIMNTLIQNRTNTSNRINTRIPVPCENQIFSYEGYAHNEVETALCTESGMTTCPLQKDCSPVNITSNGMVMYSDPNAITDFTNGTVATYSCDDGYELVGEETRTCLVDGTWTGAEPECQVSTPPSPTPAPSSLPGWAIAIIVIIIILLVVGVAVAVIVVLLWRYGVICRAMLQNKRHSEVEMSENVSYGPLPARKQQATSSSAGGGGTSVQGSAPEYEEIGPAIPSRMY